MEVESLQKLGFTLNEAKIYLALLELGPSQSGRINKKTQINRRTTYDTIERLIEKGYLSFIIKSNKKIFRAINPQIIFEKIKEMESEFKKISHYLKKLYKGKKEGTEANIFLGRKGIRNILNNILKQKEYVVFGSNEKFPEIMQHDFDIFQKNKKELGIKSKVIMSISIKNKPMLKEAFAVYKFSPAITALPISTFIYGNKIAIIIWSEIPVGMLIENKDISLAFKGYFNAVWKTTC